MAHQVRSLIFLPIIVAGFSVLGGVYGNGVQAAIDEPEMDESGVSGDVLGFTKFYALVAQNFADRLLSKANVAVVPGAAFGDDRTIRFSYATSLDIIKKGLDRFEEFTKTL